MNTTCPESITLNFTIRAQDVLALAREYRKISPTFQRMRTRVRLMVPLMVLAIWGISLYAKGFSWAQTLVFALVAALWFLFYPARFDRNAEKYQAKVLKEEGHNKGLGPCELVLSAEGLRSRGPLGQSTYYWDAVEGVWLTDSHLLILLSGGVGYPVQVAEIGMEVAEAAYRLACSQAKNRRA